MNIEYFIFLFFAFSLFFLFIRSTVIDLATEYVPNNIVIGSYTITIMYAIIEFIRTKNLDYITSGLMGFLAAFVIPFIISLIPFLIKYIPYKLKHKGEEIPDLDEKYRINENPPISKNLYSSLYSIGSIMIFTFGLLQHNIYIIYVGTLALIFEIVLFSILKPFFKIDYDFSKAKDMPKELIEQEEEVIGGIGFGDIILFGALGIMFGVSGFITIFLYSAICQIFVIVLYSIIKKVNPFNNPIPFIPGITLGLFIYIAGLDQYLLNFSNLFVLFM